MGASISLGGSECFPNLASPTELRLAAAEVNKRDEDNALFERGLPPWWAEPLGDTSLHSVEASQDVRGQPSTPTAEKVEPHNSVLAHAVDDDSSIVNLEGTEPNFPGNDVVVKRVDDNSGDRTKTDPQKDQLLSALATAPTLGVASAIPTNTVPGFHPKSSPASTVASTKQSSGPVPSSDVWIGSGPQPGVAPAQFDGKGNGKKGSSNKSSLNSSDSNSALRADLLRFEAVSAKGHEEARASFLSLLAQGGLGHRSKALLDFGVESVEDARDPVRGYAAVFTIEAFCARSFKICVNYFIHSAKKEKFRHFFNSYACSPLLVLTV